MARRKRKQLITGLLLLLCSALFPTLSHADDGGLIASIEASHKFSKKLSAGLETEFRARNNFRTADRVSIGGDVSYKVLPWLKASAGYTLLIDNNREKLTYQDDNVQYTYRPSKIIDNFDFDEGEWEDDEVKGKGKNVLRSRLQAEWDIPKCKFDPFANVEFHTTRDLEKTRFIVGVSHSLKKKHNFKFYYRCQLSGSSDEPNNHMLGMGYTYKF